ncbi:capsule biosynthesis protein CapA [Jannaschia pagri]|uniref:Capsule biosynthesis protein CapA n=1 Tax=Jannaschia pagri TaxID=2829797 RepID=A0ABQ4NIC0_9RHOB|nr:MULTISPECIES: capsular biosynthesis protein [unclassified Jannaschia]GIT89719.1 capsule biosynthesis protein CapA [Jannaschia sp. AI_61]GIT94173.1 capsule biosynthesis protein CapA [Jannaschia sp. AI_62]
MRPARRFLFLQGPHGPFFHHLGGLLRAAGCETWRVAFNRGDDAFWFDRRSLIPFQADAATWPEACASLMAEKGITDLVLYGDTRPIHAEAIKIARDRGLTIHVFEEGYLRPWWVSYERGGSNANSRLMTKSVAAMQAELAELDLDLPDAPAHWGDMRHHVYYGMLYHWFVLSRPGKYRAYRPHRQVTVLKEFRLYLRRLVTMPFTALERRLATRRITHGGFPYHLCLMQLEHDASFQAHSPYASMTEFLEEVIAGFARGAPAHHHLVLKAHPLEDGRAPIQATIRRLVAEHNLAGRVHYLRGGKLAGLMNEARSAITVNSTAAQQALWRGLPLKALGRSVYSKPEFVSDQPIEAFFADPDRPDSRAYRDYRHYLLETSQVAGGFYSARGRRQLLRQVVDMMLSDLDPYDRLSAGKPVPRQNLKLVSG